MKIIAYVLFLTTIFFGTLTALFIRDAPYRVTHKQIIEHNCGQYNQQTGEFEWLIK